MLKLYEYMPTRSARCRWTALEAGIDFESVAGVELIGSPQLREVHPMAKLPALATDHGVLFESAAISTFLADSRPEANLIAPSGTWERALHDQWVSFTLTELEAWLWSNEKHTQFYPDELQRPEIVEPNNREIKAALGVLEEALGSAGYLVADRFSVTDIIVGYTVSWAAEDGHIAELPNLRAYFDRLLQREHCTLKPA